MADGINWQPPAHIRDLRDIIAKLHVYQRDHGDVLCSALIQDAKEKLKDARDENEYEWHEEQKAERAKRP